MEDAGEDEALVHREAGGHGFVQLPTDPELRVEGS